MRLLIISNMYPNNMHRESGIFIHRQVKETLNSDCIMKVLSPIPYAPSVLKVKTKWKNYGQIHSYDVIDGVPVYYPRYLNLPGAWFHGPSAYTMYAALLGSMDPLIKEFKPQLIHAHAVTPAGYAALILKRKYNLPLICSLRGSDINIYPYRDSLIMQMTKKVISGADQLISVSYALRTAAARIGSPTRAIQVVYNGCDTEKFFPDRKQGMRIRKTLGIPVGDKVLIFVGSLSKNKGVYELFNSFEELLSFYDDIHLIMAGDGPEQENLSGLIKNKGMKDRMHLLGKQRPDEIPKYLNASDYFILPTHYEGLPNAVLEAMACGLPIIATGVGGIPEAVKDGRNGILVNRLDNGSLTSAIKCLYRDNKLAKQMGINNRSDIERSFSWKKNSGQLIEIYKEFINARD